MTPLDQTVFATDDPAGPVGNCLQAAIASLLDLPLDAVPHFVGDDVATGGEMHWWTQWRRWCIDCGLTVCDAVEPEPGELYLGGGPSPRDPEHRSHVAIYRDGGLIHDPYPGGTGVVKVRVRWTIRPS
jgi:hypothetical protein